MSTTTRPTVLIHGYGFDHRIWYPVELAFEGHNSFDYFRNGLPMTRTAADNNGTALTIQPTDPKVVLELPKN